MKGLFIDDLLLEGSTTGSIFCAELTKRVDQFIEEIFEAAGSPSETAVCAIGGYGRKELCPGSDIDVLLIHDQSVDVLPIAEKIWYPLWDAGLKLGHQVGTQEEILNLAESSLETATSLLSSRAVAGDNEIVDLLAERAQEQWIERFRKYLKELGSTVEDRYTQYGEVAFLLEPELKQGRGGLRDAHILQWMEIAEPILITSEATVLLDAVETLLSVRVELHRVTGKRSDRLLLELQDEVAEQLKYKNADELMGAVANAARVITWTGDGAARRIERIRQSRPIRKSLGKLRNTEIAPDLDLDTGRLGLTQKADTTDPFLPLRAAVAATKCGAYLERASLEKLAESKTEIPQIWPEEARELFIELLMSGPDAVPIIEDLDQYGLFSHLIPEWESCRSKPQRNAYHMFTVDRHLLETVSVAAGLTATVDRPDLLVLGALLHDIGKGFPGDHTEIGMNLVESIAKRMGYENNDVELLVGMIEHHLLLPDVATRRDLDDDGTIKSVASAVKTLSLLSLLDALTEADSIATGSSAWSTWKAGLVRELVARVQHVLSGGNIGDVVETAFPSRKQLDVMATGEEVFSGDKFELTVITNDRPGVFSKIAGVLALNGHDVIGADAFSEAGRALSVFSVAEKTYELPKWEEISLQVKLALDGRLALAARLGERSRIYTSVSTSAKPFEPKVEVDNFTSDFATVLEVSCPDGVGVLYRITRAFAELDLNIVRARVQTLGSDVVDAFYVLDVNGRKIEDPDHLEEIELAVLRWLTTDL
ncbi:MAG: [protein-PII] uridylyltransferase [Acidimicrobiales bacterium]|jgi:[protein-PII] uridylyltransferase|nr:[protein-PII] uridylyltransferase [Acidimicrobiales bacterium]